MSTLQDQTLFQPVGFDDYNFECTGERTSTLRSGASGGACGVTIAFDVYNMADTGAVSKTLNSVRSDTDHVPVVMEAKTFDTRGNGDGEVCCTITGDHENRVTDYTSVVVEPSTFAMQAIGEYKESGIASSLKSRDFKDATDLVSHNAYSMKSIARSGVPLEELANPICGSDYKDPDVVAYDADHVGHIVRRLTPDECELLQGFPKGWTDIGDWVDSKGKKHKAADSPRYKALGNSICLPPWKFVLKRLCAQYERDATMASLFDGIGGFPLLWEQLNGKGTCIWASEIEEFPMAVTKKRFGGTE